MFLHTLDMVDWLTYQAVRVDDAVCGPGLNKETLLLKKIGKTIIFSPNKFADHLQFAFEYIPVQELILLILTEEVRRHIGTARQWNHCPVVSLNMI